MSNKKNPKKKMVTPVGVALFPHLLAPDKKFAKGGVGKYKTRLAFDPNSEEFKKFRADAQAWFDEQKANWLASEAGKKFSKTNKPKAEGFREEIDSEGEPTGRIFISASMNEFYDDEKTKKRVYLSPDIRDSRGLPAKPKAIWGGSELRLAVQLGFHTQGAEYTESFRLLGVQIVKLVKGQNAGDMFGAFGGGYDASEDDDGYDASEESEADEGNEGEDSGGGTEDF